MFLIKTNNIIRTECFLSIYASQDKRKIQIRNNEILLLRRFGTGYRDGEYSVIAGHLDGGEKAMTAVVREAKEEADIIVNLENLELACIMHRRSEEERIDFFFAAKSWKGNPKIMEHNKCDDLRWFSLNNLPDNMVPYIKKLLKAMLMVKSIPSLGGLNRI